MIKKFKELHEAAFFAGLFHSTEELTGIAMKAHSEQYFKEYEKPFRVVSFGFHNNAALDHKPIEYFKFKKDAWHEKSNRDFLANIECLCVNGEWVKIV